MFIAYPTYQYSKQIATELKYF